MATSSFMRDFRNMRHIQTCYCSLQVVVEILLGQLAPSTALAILTDIQTTGSVCGISRPALAAASPSPFMSLI